MPRKKDGMLVEFYPRPTTGEDGKPLLFARPAIGFKYNIRGVDDFCHKYRGMPMGEMNRLFTAFLDVASWLMHDGSRVETPIGSFAPKLKLSGDFTDPKQIKSENVGLGTIEFIPSKLFIQELQKYLQTGFREKKSVVERKPMHELRKTGRIEEVLKELFQERNSFGIELFAVKAGMKYNTARMYLNKLCEGENPQLTKHKFGNKVFYMSAAKKQTTEK